MTPRPDASPRPDAYPHPEASARLHPDPCVTDGHCITCSDEGVPMRVDRLLGPGLATCVDASGGRSDVMTALVEDVRPGDTLLVHAGTALIRVDRSSGCGGIT